MYAVFEVFLGEVVDGIEGFLGLILVIAKQNFLNVRQTVAEEHVLGAEEADVAGALVEGGFGFGGFRVRADVEGLDFLAPVENGLSGFFELAGNSHGDFAEVNFASRTADGDVITTFNRIAVAAEGTGGFVDRDFGSTDDGGNAPCGLCGCASLFFKYIVNLIGQKILNFVIQLKSRFGGDFFQFFGCNFCAFGRTIGNIALFDFNNMKLRIRWHLTIPVIHSTGSAM